jgi:hypothetical protein
MFTNIAYNIILLFSICFSQPPVTLGEFIKRKNQMNQELDVIDAYKLKVGSAFLFGKLDAFLSEMGLPAKVSIAKKEVEIKSKIDLDKIVSDTKPPQIVVLQYTAIEMWYAYDGEIIPFSIDFRKFKNKVTYEETTFDSNYPLKKFVSQYPNSANSSFKLPSSFFEMATKETGKDLKHYLLTRKSKDDAGAAPMVEFTFQNEKLIYIFFANF